MNQPGVVPFFDGHNDVLLRLYRHGGTRAPQAFLEGGEEGHLDLRRLFKVVSPEDSSLCSFRHRH
jgi:membrane dipeptidase